MDYDDLLFGSRASAPERAQVNEDTMLKALQAEAMDRNMYLEQQSGFGAAFPGFCNTNLAESRVKAVETTYLNLGQATLRAAREGKIKTDDVLYTQIKNLGNEIQTFIDNWGWGSIMWDACGAIEEADRYLGILEDLTGKLAATGAKTPTPYVPPKKWSTSTKLIVAGSLFGAGYLAYLFLGKKG